MHATGAENLGAIISAIAAMVAALSIAALVIVFGRWLERTTSPASHRRPRWPDQPAMGQPAASPRDWAAPDEAPVRDSLRDEPATLERMYATTYPAAEAPREHVHDFYRDPCWCGWGEPIARVSDIARRHSAIATWAIPEPTTPPEIPVPAGPTDVLPVVIDD